MAAPAGGLPYDAAIAVLMGAARPGTPVPPLEDLARLCGLEVLDAAAGLELLLQRHAVEFVPGSNRLVTRRIPYRIDHRVHASLSEGVDRSGSIRPGMSFRSLVRAVDELPAPVEIAQPLAIPAGTSVVRLRRERMLGDEPVVVATSWLRVTSLAVDDLVDRLFQSMSLAAVLEQLNHRGPYRRLRYRVALAHPSSDVAGLFGPARDELAWWVESVNGVDDHEPLELSQAWLRADVFRLLVGDDPA
jgi:DNA-binding GntR family transcriptional regulator